MTQPTHTHRENGGRYVEVSEHAGTGPLEGQQLVVYHDLDRDVMSATTLEDWRQHWQAIAKDDCSVCLGTGTDQIKGNRDKPCGGCFGLGKVRQDGETPADRWELAEVAGKIIKDLRAARCQLRAKLQVLHETPGVTEAVEADQARWKQHATDAQAKQERSWREGRGYGPGGARHTGD